MIHTEARGCHSIWRIDHRRCPRELQPSADDLSIAKVVEQIPTSRRGAIGNFNCR
jgi:hypothetical protein